MTKLTSAVNEKVNQRRTLDIVSGSVNRIARIINITPVSNLYPLLGLSAVCPDDGSADKGCMDGVMPVARLEKILLDTYI
ncbi:hypothetical protein MNBD_UNCLBAC01-1273 [hydrothermal vent metagenome]|uniref:Uncharacterized protein n=1 Tax=hydrothermal vent metagenome TaxID=652676 RepID=A0A3B1DP64_9ZZZZ